MNNGNGNAGRIEALKERQKQIQAALAAELLKHQRRQAKLEKREMDIIGAAVVKAAAVSPEFRIAVAQISLVNITDEKQRRFLADRGWDV